jgi:hypothetical protein
MKRLFICLFFVCATGYAQFNESSLDQLKIDADAGNAAAQDKLAEKMLGRIQIAEAEALYRKSAEQGYAHAQGQLGKLLLSHYNSTFGQNPEVRTAMGEEAVKWVTLAANQGDKQGQADLANICLGNQLVKQDLIEAYKWGDLAGEGVGITFEAIEGRSARDTAILKMDADQINEAKRRVVAFVPHQPQQSEKPIPAWVQKIKLNGISGAPTHRLAVIGSHTFQEGDGGNLKVDGKSVAIRCLIITDSSAVVSIGGIEGTRILTLN